MEEWKNLGSHISERSVLNDPLFWKYIILFYQNIFAPPERTNIEHVKDIYATPWSVFTNSSIIHFSVLQVFHSSIPSFFRCVRFPKFFRFSRGSGFHLGAGKLEIRISAGYPEFCGYPVDIRRISGGGISNFPARDPQSGWRIRENNCIY